MKWTRLADRMAPGARFARASGAIRSARREHCQLPSCIATFCDLSERLSKITPRQLARSISFSTVLFSIWSGLDVLVHGGDASFPPSARTLALHRTPNRPRKRQLDCAEAGRKQMNLATECVLAWVPPRGNVLKTVRVRDVAEVYCGRVASTS